MADDTKHKVSKPKVGDKAEIFMDWEKTTPGTDRYKEDLGAGHGVDQELIGSLYVKKDWEGVSGAKRIKVTVEVVEAK